MAEEYLNYGSQVVATVRSAQRTELHDLQDTAAGRLEIEHTDITIPEHIVDLHHRPASSTFDLLFVNAGITNDADDSIADSGHPAYGHVRPRKLVHLIWTSGRGPVKGCQHPRWSGARYRNPTSSPLQEPEMRRPNPRARPVSYSKSRCF